MDNQRTSLAGNTHLAEHGSQHSRSLQAGGVQGYSMPLPLITQCRPQAVDESEGSLGGKEGEATSAVDWQGPACAT